MIILGHRANTPRWVRRFLAEGADGVEMDVYCRGGELYASHLSLVGRARLLRERIASLLTGLHLLGPYRARDLLALVPQGSPVMLDLKSRVSEECLAELSVLSEGYKVYVSIRDYDLAPRLAEKGLSVLLSMDHRPLGVLDELRAASAAGVSINKRYLDEDLARLLRGHGYIVAAWTINTAEEAIKVSSMGADIIVTDYPGIARKVLRSRASTPKKGEW